MISPNDKKNFFIDLSRFINKAINLTNLKAFKVRELLISVDAISRATKSKYLR